MKANALSVGVGTPRAIAGSQWCGLDDGTVVVALGQYWLLILGSDDEGEKDQNVGDSPDHHGCHGCVLEMDGSQYLRAGRKASSYPDRFLID